MPIASLTATTINLPAPAGEGRARESLAGRESRERAPRTNQEQRSDAKSARRDDQPGSSARANTGLAGAAHEQQFIAAFESKMAQLSSVSASFENLSTTQSHALRSYQQTQNIDTGNAPAGSELIVGIDTFV